MKRKKMNNGLMAVWVVLLMATFGLTGCTSNDQYLCDLLRNRDWQGYIATYYQDRWGISGNDYRTVMRFTSSDPWATSGRGEELEYSTYSRNSYAYCTFKWFIVDGEITLLYDDSKWNPIYIVDYRLTGSFFRGYIYDGTNRRISFDLENTGYDDWGYYRNRAGRYGDFINQNYYWSRETRGSEEVDANDVLFINRTPFCQSDDGQGRCVLSGEFAEAFVRMYGSEDE